MADKKTRRGHGEGTHYQREDGYWVAQITLGKDAKGRQIRKTFSAKTEKEVLAKKKEYLYKQMRGELPKTNKVILGEWMLCWLKDYKKQNIRQTTYENYETLIKRHIVENPIGKIQIQKLTTDQIQKFMGDRAERGGLTTVTEEVEEEGIKKTIKKQAECPLSASTVKLIHHLIQAALGQAEKNNIIHKNVAKNCERYRGVKKEIKPLSKEDLAALIEAVKGHRLYPALMLELYTGMRRGELLALRWENIDLEQGKLKIVESLVRVRGGSQFQKPKTSSSVRELFLHPKAVEILKEHQAKQEKEKRSFEDSNNKENRDKDNGKNKVKDKKEPDEKYIDDGLVFCLKNGKKIDPRNFQRVFDRWLKKADLPKETRFHDLRHTFITHMLAGGVDIKTLQSITGHADTRTLLDVYAHPVQEAQKEALKKLDAVLPA